MNLRSKFEKSPILKTLINITTLVLFSIFSGAFVTEITIDGVIYWSLFYEATSFYILLFLVILMYFYYRFIFSIEKNILAFQDDAYCNAYMRKECLPEVAKRVNELIKNGQNGGDLKTLMEDFKL